ncbi:NAD(P)-dependent oxidoreductase [Roseococcus sp. DSY-14]|uniref:NAD(P)-dependent oxidoreductase n=1 Tax=Roseococcus sp. DSY-14 TaxID=3369650 RepID=UPI00387A9B10
MSIAFIGLGTMGRLMARNLARAGHAVRGFDALPDAAAEGVARAATLAECVAGADTVILMLPDTPDVEAVAAELEGLLPPGTLVLDMSSIAPGAAWGIQARLAARGVGFVDAPVSGGPMGADLARLTIMAGGTAEDFARAEPVFAAMGTTITHMGGPGAGQATKLCNQVMVGLNIQAVCEGLALGRAAGLDLERLREVLLGGSAASWMLDVLGPKMMAGDVAAGFRIDLMLKDLRLAGEAARALDLPLPGTALVTQQYVECRAHGEGGNGNQALMRHYDRLAGLP